MIEDCKLISIITTTTDSTYLQQQLPHPSLEFGIFQGWIIVFGCILIVTIWLAFEKKSV